jgi:hypothetical protein
LQNPFYLIKNLIQYFVKQSGPFTNNVADFLAWEKLAAVLRPSLGDKALEELAQFPDDWPEVEYLSGAGYIGDWSGLLLKRTLLFPRIIWCRSNADKRRQSPVTATNTLPSLPPSSLLSREEQ